MHLTGLRRALAVLAAVLSIGAARAADAPTPQQLEAVEAALKHAKDRSAELARQADTTAARIAELQAEMVAVAQRAQDSEASLTTLEEELGRYEKSETAMRAELTGEESRLVDTLAALQRLSMQPREAMIVRSGAPLDTVRSAMLLKVAVPTLGERAGALRQKLDRLRDLRAEIARRRAGQETSVAALRAENERLAGLLQEMETLKQSTEIERGETEKRLAALTAEKKDLSELVEALETERKRQEAMLPPATDEPDEKLGPVVTVPRASPGKIRAFPKDGQGVVMPARGVLVERYGEPGEAGFKNRGIKLRTRPGADVVAMFDGQVVFNQRFAGYGETLLIAHRGGYYTVLAGLGRTVVTVDQWLVAGEPVGMMGPSDAGNPKLYIELRRGEVPIDPAPWLGLRDK